MEIFILDFKGICDKTDICPVRFDLSDFDLSIKTWFVKKFLKSNPFHEQVLRK